MAVFHGKNWISCKSCKTLLANPKHSRVYGRRLSRPLNKSRSEAMESVLPRIEIPAELLKQDQSLVPSVLFETADKPLWLEIGFGSGEHLSALMRQHPENNYLGAEPFINGMAAFVKDIADEDNNNIRVLMDDALLLCESLSDSCLDRIYVLNPDPWHKKRHHKRRIVNPDSLDTFARTLKPGGELIMSSDVTDMADWMLTHTINHPAFDWTAKKADDWRNAPKDWIPTRYETKGAKGAKVMTYLIFKNNPCENTAKDL